MKRKSKKSLIKLYEKERCSIDYAFQRLGTILHQIAVEQACEPDGDQQPRSSKSNEDEGISRILLD